MQQLVKEGWIERPTRGQYALLPSIHGRIRQLEEAVRKREVPAGSDLNAELAGLNRAKREAQEMKNELTRGELAPVTDIEFALAKLCSGVRTRILAVPAKVAPAVAAESSPAVCHEIIESEIVEALEAISNVSVATLPRGDETP